MYARQLKFSIVIPTKDAEKYLDESLDSIEAQDYPNYEVIIIDGYSADHTKQIADQYKNVQFYRATPQGEADAINRGMSVTTGDIVAFLDPDDVYLKGCFKSVNANFGANPNSKWLYGKGKIIDQNGYETRSIVSTAKSLVRYSYKALMCVDFICQPTVFIKRSLYDDAGNFRTDLKYSFEYDYWLRLGQRYEPIFVDRYLAAWRAHSDSISVKGYIPQTDQAREIQRHYSGKSWLNPIQDVVYHGTRLLYKVIQVKLRRGCCNQQGFATFQCLCYIIAGLVAIVSALCFASLVMLNPAVGMPIVGAITALAFFMAMRSKPATKATNKDTDDSNRGGTNGIPSKKVSKKTSAVGGAHNEIDKNNNSNHEPNNGNNNVNCTHIQPPIHNSALRGCYPIIYVGRIKPQRTKCVSGFSICIRDCMIAISGLFIFSLCQIRKSLCSYSLHLCLAFYYHTCNHVPMRLYRYLTNKGYVLNGCGVNSGFTFEGLWLE